MPQQTPQTSQSSDSPRIDPKKALEILNLTDESDLPLDDFEDELIKQTSIAKDMGFERAKLFFKAMTTQESGGKESAVSPKSARGRYQVTDTLAKSKYKGLDNTNPAFNRYMGIDYWDEGYEKSKEFSSDPVERAAIATSYFHGGDGALNRLRKSGGELSTADDGLITTNDHVFAVMNHWKKGIEGAGLNFDLDPQSDDPKMILEDETPATPSSPPTVQNFFTGKLENPGATPGATAPDERSRLQTFKATLSPEEQAQYATASPDRRKEMFFGMIAGQVGGDRQLALEGLRKLDQFGSDDPAWQEGIKAYTEIGSLGEVNIDTAIPRLVQAYQSGGMKAMNDVKRQVDLEREAFAKEREQEKLSRAAELSATSQSFRGAEAPDAGAATKLATMAGSSFASGIHGVVGGVAGIGGAIAGKLGLDELDRELSQYSLLASDKQRIIKEEQDLLEKRSTIPGVVMSTAKVLGGLPVILGSAVAGGPSGVYLTSLAQSAREEPLKAIINSQFNAVMIGSTLEGMAGKELAKAISMDSFGNALQLSPDFAQVAALKLYAKQNPGKVSKAELEAADKRLGELTNDLAANLLIGGTMAGVHALGNRGRSVADTDGRAMSRVEAIYDLGEPVKVAEKAPTATEVPTTPEVPSTPPTDSEVRSGAITSISKIIAPDPEVPLTDLNGEPLGKIFIGADPVPGQDFYLARFTDSQGRALPPELISAEGAEIYNSRLARVGKVGNAVGVGQSMDDLTTAIREAQPTKEELGEAKVEARLREVAKETAEETPPVEPSPAEANYQSKLAQFDQTLSEFNARKAAIRQQLDQMKKYADEPDFITKQRLILKESATGEQSNMGANLLPQAIVLGYDTYRTLKDAGLGFAEWLVEVKSKVDSAVHPYLADIYEKILFLGETKTKGNISRNPDGSWKFDGEPVRVFHATSAGFDEVGYNTDHATWLKKVDELSDAKFAVESSYFAKGDYNYASDIEYQRLVKELDAQYKLEPIEDTYRRGFQEFSTSKYGTSTDIGWYGIGIYFGDLNEASKYAHGEGANIRPNYLRVENPLVWEYGKDSSIQRYLQYWKIEDGQVLSPKDRTPNALDLPKEIHAETEAFVRDYLENKYPNKSDEVQQLRIALDDVWNRQISLLERTNKLKTAGKTREAEIAKIEYDKLEKQYKNIETKLDTLQENRSDHSLTDDELHQLSRGITTIMKDKGYDGVFVVESQAYKHSEVLTWDKFNKWASKKSNISPNEIVEAWNTKNDLYAEFVDYSNASSYRIKEYVAFSPDQILSTLEGWTPRHELTGELLDPQKSAFRQGVEKFLSEEKGEIDLDAILDTADYVVDSLYRWGRGVNRFMTHRGKNIRASIDPSLAKLYADSPLDVRRKLADSLTLEDRKLLWENRVDFLNSEYPNATAAEKSRITKEISSLTSKLNGLDKLIAKSPANTSQGEALATEWVNRLSAGANTKAMLLDFYQRSKPLLEGLGSNINEYFRYRQQDRLEGVRDRYNLFAKLIPAMTDDDLILSFVQRGGMNFNSVIKAINHIQPGAYDDANVLYSNLQKAAESGDFTTIRKQLENLFTVAASNVPQTLFPQYHSYRANNRLDPLNALYKSTIEDVMRLKFEETDSSPSAHLGNDNLYFPLVAEETGPTVKPKLLQAFRKVEYAKPKSPAAHFTTGLSEAYSTDIIKLAENLTKQYRAGDRAGLVQNLLDTGIARELQKVDDGNGRWVDDDIPEGYVKKDVGPHRVYSTKKSIVNAVTGETTTFAKEFSQPVAQILIPKSLAKELDILIDPKYADLSEAQLQNAIGAITNWNLIGPLDLVFHSWNVLDALRSRLGYLPTDVFSAKSRSGQAMAFLANKALSGMGSEYAASIPIVGNPMRMAYTVAKAFEQNLFSKDQLRRDKSWNNLQYALQRGFLPERTGETTYFPEIANATKSHLVGIYQWKSVRDIYNKLQARRGGELMPEPTRDPSELMEGSWAERNFGGTRYEGAAKLTKKVFQTASSSPLVFGWGGLDTRARLAAAEALQHYAPNLTPYETFEATTILGIYNRFAESEISNFLKQSHIAPFYSAASARTKRIFQAWTRPVYGARSGLMRDSSEDRKGQPLYDRVVQSAATFLSESTYAHLTMWAITYHATTGLWPWEDEKSKLLQMRLSQEDITRSRFLSTVLPHLNPDPHSDVYVGFSPMFGGGGGELFGLGNFYKAMARTIPAEGGNFPTMGERLSLATKSGLAQAATNLGHVAMSGPLPHIAAKGIFGVDLAITYQPKQLGGGFEYRIPQVRGPMDKALPRQLLGAFFESNSFFENIGEWGGATPNHQRYDNPVTSDMLKFFFQMGTKNAIKQQENPGLTRQRYMMAIGQGRAERGSQAGAAER